MLILETLTWEVQLESVRDGEDGLNFLRRQKLLWCGPVFISIREGGFVGRFPDPEMNQFAQAATQTIADLTQRVGMGELAEQHRHQLRPATEAFGAPFGLVLLDQRSELGARKMLEQLIEQTGCLYDWSALLFPDSGQDRPAANEQILLSIDYRRSCSLDCLTRHSTQESVLDKSDRISERCGLLRGSVYPTLRADDSLLVEA